MQTESLISPGSIDAWACELTSIMMMRSAGNHRTDVRLDLLLEGRRRELLGMLANSGRIKLIMSCLKPFHRSIQADRGGFRKQYTAQTIDYSLQRATITKCDDWFAA